MSSVATNIDPELAPPARSNGAEDRIPLDSCCVCGSRRLRYAFSKNSYRLVRCAECRLLFVNPQPSAEELRAIYAADYFLGDGATDARVSAMKTATALQYLALLGRYGISPGGTLLEIGCGRGEFIAAAEAAGFDVTGVEISATAAEQAATRIVRGRVVCGSIESADLPPGSFDVCVLSDVIEHVRNPVELLHTLHSLLKPGGVIFIATPSMDSWSAKLLRQNWMELKPEHLTYFDTDTIQHALFVGGYAQVCVMPGWKILNLDYVARHFSRFPVPVVSRVVGWTARVAPERLLRKDVPVVASGMVAIARRVELTARRKVSIIVPAYNEAATVEPLLQSLLRKRFADLDSEIIVVESNSTDGTRAVVQRYASEPGVRVILQDRPRGKGQAVRDGLAAATGDFILIQDADLEYDLEDYDALLQPLAEAREAFVLGTRHGGSAWWKMRKFADQPLLALFTNCGHWFFTALLNVLFRQRLRDPFTMFKVFRRDCLSGLEFQCNRFDFDIELLVKLLRKGYRPLEIPVNYRSRSYKQGKKVNALRDPWTWLYALARLRLQPARPVMKRAVARDPFLA